MRHVFDYKSKTSDGIEETVMTVLDRMPAGDLVARISDGPTGYTGVDGDAKWAAEVRRLADVRGATLLAHNYQLPSIQDVADHVGDSLALSRIAAEAAEDTIVFCGVHFMAETAKILSPDKTVLIPDQRSWQRPRRSSARTRRC
jgi:quinolinate synthase